MTTGDIWLNNTSRYTLLVVNGDKSLHGKVGVTAAGRTSTLITIWSHMTSLLTILSIPCSQHVIHCVFVCVYRQRIGGRQGEGWLRGRRGHRGGRGRQRDEPSSHTVNSRVHVGVRERVDIYILSLNQVGQGRIVHLSFWQSEKVTAGRRRKRWCGGEI